jgi:hypothetical protein
VAAPAVLLLNDRYTDNWKVLVDGKPGTLLRCNYLMRGVQLEPGTHTVEFVFQVPIGSLWVTVAAEILGLLLLAFLVFTREPPPTAAGGSAAPRVTA